MRKMVSKTGRGVSRKRRESRRRGVVSTVRRVVSS